MTSPNRVIKFFDIAKSERDKSPLPIKLGAVLAKGNRVIKSSYNTGGYFRFVGSWTRHAEVRATLNVNCEGAVMYVYREHAKLQSPLLAKPCASCVEWMKYVGVSEVVYSIPQYPYWESMSL